MLEIRIVLAISNMLVYRPDNIFKNLLTNFKLNMKL